MNPPQSIHDLTPLEIGGVIARSGFIFQDHIAVHFCLQLITDSNLSQVWCETQDDITLIWNRGTDEEVEFVQVKNNQFDQLWTIAKLCEREKSSSQQNKSANSILEKSLQYDRCLEECYFRIITSRGVHSDMSLLTLPRNHVERNSTNKDYIELINKINIKTNGYISINGNKSDFWVNRTLWEVYHSIEAVKNRNILLLCDYLSSIELLLSPDQIEEKIYNKILKMIQDAGSIDNKQLNAKKKILKEEFILWIREITQEQINLSTIPAGIKLKNKLEKACLSLETIASANESRRYYRQTLISPKYFDISDKDFIESEIVSLMQKLRSQLDAGEINDNGLEFHSRCLKALDDLQKNLQTNQKPPMSFLQGCMYNITDRCLHRFQKEDILL